MAQALAGKPAAQVAELSEFLKLPTVLLRVGAKGTNAAFRQNAVAQLKRLFQVDVQVLSLTDRGFAKK